MLSISSVQDSQERISASVLETPCLYSTTLSKLTGANVYLKLESEQETGSFKLRGALNKILMCSDKGLFYTASTGNHALGVAKALQVSGKAGKVFMPVNAKKNKIEAVKKLGVEVFLHGRDSLETELYAKKEARKANAVWVSPYNDKDVISGQGTIALEILKQVPQTDVIFACVGGGGMISGIGSAMKQQDQTIMLVGCMPENSPEMCLSIKQDEYVTVPFKPTLSDGSAGPFEKGSITFDLCKELVDSFELISESEIEEGIRLMYNYHGKIIEGAASVALMGCLKHATHLKDKNVVVVVCGSNIDLNSHNKIIA